MANMNPVTGSVTVVPNGTLGTASIPTGALSGAIAPNGSSTLATGNALSPPAGFSTTGVAGGGTLGENG